MNAIEIKTWDGSFITYDSACMSLCVFMYKQGHFDVPGYYSPSIAIQLALAGF